MNSDPELARTPGEERLFRAWCGTPDDYPTPAGWGAHYNEWTRDGWRRVMAEARRIVAEEQVTPGAGGAAG